MVARNELDFQPFCEVAELLEHLELAVSLNIFYKISEHFLQRDVVE